MSKAERIGSLTRMIAQETGASPAKANKKSDGTGMARCIFPAGCGGTMEKAEFPIRAQEKENGVQSTATCFRPLPFIQWMGE